MYLLDTNVLGRLVQREPPTHLLERLAQLSRSDAYTSSVNYAELIYGLVKGGKGPSYFLRLERLVANIPILSFDAHCAEIYGRLRSALEAKGVSLPPSDLMIAAVALGNGLILVTANERHFVPIADLQVENWLREP
jgi:tRNA(fMet)-specific endonuclease VapC